MQCLETLAQDYAAALNKLWENPTLETFLENFFCFQTFLPWDLRQLNMLDLCLPRKTFECILARHGKQIENLEITINGSLSGYYTCMHYVEHKVEGVHPTPVYGVRLANGELAKIYVSGTVNCNPVYDKQFLGYALYAPPELDLTNLENELPESTAKTFIKALAELLAPIGGVLAIHLSKTSYRAKYSNSHFLYSNLVDINLYGSFAMLRKLGLLREEDLPNVPDNEIVYLFDLDEPGVKEYTAHISILPKLKELGFKYERQDSNFYTLTRV